MHFANMRIMGHRNLLSGLISEMNRSYKAAIGRSVNSPLMMKRYNEFSCNTHKKKGDDTLANSARSMPNWHTSGLSEKGRYKSSLSLKQKSLSAIRFGLADRLSMVTTLSGQVQRLVRHMEHVQTHRPATYPPTRQLPRRRLLALVRHAATRCGRSAYRSAFASSASAAPIASLPSFQSDRIFRTYLSFGECCRMISQ